MSDVKTCHHCHTTFPSGLTCPSCHAFVPDAPPDDDLRASPAPPGWAVIIDDTTSSDASSTDSTSIDTGAVESSPSEPSEPSDNLPVAYPSWARQPDDLIDRVDLGAVEDLPSRSPYARPRPAPAAAVPAAPPSTFEQRWAEPTGWRGPIPAETAPGPSGPLDDGPRARPATFSLTPATLAFGIAAVVVIVLIGALVLRPRSTPSAAARDVAADIAGTCFVYDGSTTRVDHTVACDGRHDGTVLAFVPDQSACPSGTDTILTTANDLQGTGGVLCIDGT